MRISYNALVTILTGKTFARTRDDWVMMENGEAFILSNLKNEWKKTHGPDQPFDAWDKNNSELKRRYILDSFPELIPLYNEMTTKNATPEQCMEILEKYRNRCPDSFEIKPILIDENTLERHL